MGSQYDEGGANGRCLKRNADISVVLLTFYVIEEDGAKEVAAFLLQMVAKLRQYSANVTKK